MEKEQLIESIIREVKRVLAERGIDVAPSYSGKSGQVSASEPVIPKKVSAGVSQQTSSKAVSEIGIRDMTGRHVITQKDLEEFKGTSIQVTKKAVITPLAFDYAREKGININRVEQTSQAAAQIMSVPGEVAVALTISPDFSGDKKFVNTILSSKGFKIKEISGSNYEDALKKLASSVSSKEVHFGICIEKTGMEGPIHANRNSKIRAVHCRGTFDARAARVDYGANVIVIDSTSNPEEVITGFCGM
jgi:ribose 5-phosphate isomerase RpiB